MNHAPGAVTALDPELIQVGDAVGQRIRIAGPDDPTVHQVRQEILHLRSQQSAPG